MASYLGEIWRCRYFWLSLVQMDLRTRYRRSVLGLGWSLLHPLMMMGILCLVFHRIFNENIHDYAPYVLTGLACWQYLVSVTTQGSDCFYQAHSYIRQWPSPLAIFPLRTALGGTVHFLIALAMAAGLTFLFKGIISPLALLGLIPALILFFLLVWSLAVLAGIATVLVHDAKHLIEIGFQILFYLTPILYRPEHLGGYRLTAAVKFNPVLAFVQLIRSPILDGQFPDWSSIGVATATVAVVGTLATLVLARFQRNLIFYL